MSVATKSINELPVLNITNAKAKPAAPANPEWWVEPMRWLALAVFIAVPLLGLFAQPLAGRVVWTMAVASLPLFIVLAGYHRWRRICPLAFFAKLPTLLKRPGTRRASARFEANYYYVAAGMFVLGLWLRLVATNGDGRMIAIFFGALTLTAVACGALFNGKTWCNYICPVSFIEKIYTEPHGLSETRNSQCTKCTACKSACPDINQENGYWREIGAQPKRHVYFLFPGLVFGFYFYYFLQAGTWSYYFGGRWTNEPGVYLSAFLPGHDAHTAGFFFLPVIPRAVAALLTLAVCGGFSLLLFTQVEKLLRRWLQRRQPAADAAQSRHLTFTIAAFTAFVTFYSFAGAPTLRLVPWLQHLFLIVVLITATMFLLRRLRRTQSAFAEVTLARNILKRWEWSDMEPPRKPHEAVLIHAARTRESERGAARLLEIYKEAVREALASGFITRQEVQRLAALREKLQLKPADHEKAMNELTEEERARLHDTSQHVCAEKRLQLEAYRGALKMHLDEVLTASTPDDRFIKRLRAEYAVTPAEHAAALAQLLDQDQETVARWAEETSLIERATRTIQLLHAEPVPAAGLLQDLLRRRRERAAERLLRGLGMALDEESSQSVRDGLCQDNLRARLAAVETLCAHFAWPLAERLRAAYQRAVEQQRMTGNLIELLRARTDSVDHYVRATALYLLGNRRAADEQLLLRLRQDEHEVVREVAEHLSGAASTEMQSPAQPRLIIEKMVVLHSLPPFAQLAAEDLAELAMRGSFDWSQTTRRYRTVAQAA
jgi:hypothetical protein